MFRKVDLVEWDGYLRLASPNLETWAAHDGLRPGLGSLNTEAVDWRNIANTLQTRWVIYSHYCIMNTV